MSVVYLHIGRGKTGTTAIQLALSSMRQLLAEHDIHYVLADDEASGSGHQRFAKGFIASPPSYMTMPGRIEEMRAAVRNEIVTSSAGKILISSENFTLADIAGLREFLFAIPSVDDVQIIFFVRSQDELAESQYNQFVKLKEMTSTFGDFLNRGMDEVDFDAMATQWADVFGEESMICRVFDAASNNVVAQFLECIDPTVDWLPKVPPVDRARDNESVGYFALNLLWLLNRIGAKPGASEAKALGEVFKNVDLPPLLFDTDAAAAYRETFFASNERFSSRFLGTPIQDLGGRRYSDDERTDIRNRIKAMPAHLLLDAGDGKL